MLWIIAATGIYEFLDQKKTRVAASLFQSILGLIALILAINVNQISGYFYFTPEYRAESHWIGSIALLAVSVILTLIATILAILSPVDSKRIEGPLAVLAPGREASGWLGAEEDPKANEANEKPPFKVVAPRYCGKLGCCAICDLCCGSVLFILWILLIALAIDFTISEPLDSCYAILPASAPASLSTAASLKGLTTGFGIFSFTFDQSGTFLNVTRRDNGANVFSTIRGEAFVRTAFGPFSAPNPAEGGTFLISDVTEALSNSQSISSFSTDQITFISFSGQLGFAGTSATVEYNLTFTQLSATNHLSVDLEVNTTDYNNLPGFDSSTDSIRLYWIHASNANEMFFGFGESYSYWNLKSTCIPIITREQGIGRGMQPFSYFVNKLADQGAGSWQTTYSAIPHYVTNQLHSMYINDSNFLVYDMTRLDRMSIEVVNSKLTAGFLSETTFLDTIEQYTLFSGRMRSLPDWVGEGAVIGLQGGTSVVMKQVQELLANGVPLTGVWIQDWTGKRVTSLGSRLLWNWIVDLEFYPGWWEMINELRAMNISMLTYINPYLNDYAPNAEGVRVIQPMFQQAESLNCLVRDKNNDTRIQFSGTRDFTYAMVDLTNPFCVDWYGGVIRENMMNISNAKNGVPYGAVGWMADFAEAVPFDGIYFDGNGSEVHNKYPQLWAETCRKAINVTSGGVNFSQEVTFFSRSSFLQSPQFATLMWLGDQMQAFNDFDGLQTVLPATASFGLSGFSLVHSDIGGYLGFYELGGAVSVVRTRELLYRWMEMSCFMDSMFRSHQGNLPANSFQVTSDNSSMAQFARFATIFRALNPYRKTLLNETQTKGYPIARHPLLHYQNDRNLDLMQTQIMLGSEIMFCPVMKTGEATVNCYLPKNSGIWTEFFDNTVTHDAGVNGLNFICSAPIGRPCVLVAPGAVQVPLARQQLANEGFQF